MKREELIQIASLTYELPKRGREELLRERGGVIALSLCGPRDSYESLRLALLRECDDDMKRAPKVDGVHQNFFQKRCFKDKELMDALVERVRVVLLEEVYKKNGFVPRHALSFESPNLQKYTFTKSSSKFAIPPHVDYKACVELVAILILEGPSLFYVAKNRQGFGARLIDAKPLDLIIMRGYQFQGIEKRPLHFIKKLRRGTRRVSLGFRVLSNNQEHVRHMMQALHKT